MIEVARVYIITDTSNAILYIGCTNDLDRRLNQHRLDKPWFKYAHMVHHKAYSDRAYAEAVEDRAIRLYDPPHNTRGTQRERFRNLGPMEREDLSERTKAGMAAAKAEGAVFGPKNKIRDFPKRLRKLNQMLKAGKLLSDDRVLLVTPKNLVEILNKADPKAPPIENAETIRRWKRDGFPWLDEETKG